MHSTRWVARILMGNPSFPRLECWLTPLGLDISTILSTPWVARHQYLLLQGAVKWAAQINKWSKVRRETQDTWAISPSALPKTVTQLEQQVCPLFCIFVFDLMFSFTWCLWYHLKLAPSHKLSVAVFAGVGLRLIGGAVLGMQLQLKDRKLA